MKLKKLFASCLTVALGVSLFAGCSGNTVDNRVTQSNTEKEGTYAFVAKDVQNTYMQKVYEGFAKACGELNIQPLFKGPQAATAQKQIDVINQLVEEGVDGIAVAANDADALEYALTKAMDAGVKVISLDSAVNKNSRQLHIQQADPEKIGRNLVQAAYQMVDGSGAMAILSATDQAPNQNLWISWMQKELEENPGKYSQTPLAKIVYGDDDPIKSASETQALLADQSIKVIIAPTVIGMGAAAKVLQKNQSSVKLTGLGLPSEMAPFIDDGTCPWMYLWNPVDIGYLAAYATDALVNGTITGELGGKFSAGTLGEKSVTAADEGGTEVLLGDPFKFDRQNIAEWKLVY